MSINDELKSTYEKTIRLILFRKNSLNNRIIYSLMKLNLECLFKYVSLKKDKKMSLNDLENTTFRSFVLKLMNLDGYQEKYFMEFLNEFVGYNSELYSQTFENEKIECYFLNFILINSIYSFNNQLLTPDVLYKLIEKLNQYDKNIPKEFTKIIFDINDSELIKKKNSIKYPITIYLDQKDWIKLARVWKNKEEDSTISSLILKLSSLVSSKDVKIVISLTNVFETMNRQNDESREDLVNLMIMFSEGWTIVPYITVIPYEIKNIIYARLSMTEKIFPIEKLVISRGIGNILGASPKIISKTDTPLDLEVSHIEEMMYTPQALKLAFSIKNKQALKERIDADKKLIANLEKNRAYFEQQFKDKELRRRARFATHFVDEINPILGTIFIEEKIPKERYSEVVGSNPEECTEFIENMPASFCSFSLTRRRDEQISAPVHEHDLYDIASLSIAIPYCDVVVCEKKFGNFAKQEKLDEKYNTIILKNLNELDEYLHY